MKMENDRMPLTFADGGETVTLGMGCFWSPEALFGGLPGVVRTRVGYAGGTVPDPTYRRMGDHTETVDIEFDPHILPLETILKLFWDNHKPVNINGYKDRQYQSLLLYRDERQKEAMASAAALRQPANGEPPDDPDARTEIAPFRTFYEAEERHQKYYVKRYPDAVRKLGELYRFDPSGGLGSTLAARLNGVAKGYANARAVREEIATWPASPEQKRLLLGTIADIRW